MKQQRSTLEKSGDAAGRPSWRSSLLDDPGAEFPKRKTRHMKNSLNVMSTCLKVVDTRRFDPHRPYQLLHPARLKVRLGNN